MKVLASILISAWPTACSASTPENTESGSISALINRLGDLRQFLHQVENGIADKDRNYVSAIYAEGTSPRSTAGEFLQATRGCVVSSLALRKNQSYFYVEWTCEGQKFKPEKSYVYRCNQTDCNKEVHGQLWPKPKGFDVAFEVVGKEAPVALDVKEPPK